jgi:glycogen(starch) synthase
LLGAGLVCPSYTSPTIGADTVKVLLVSDFLPPVVGGLEAHVAGLAEAFAQQRHDVQIATLTDDPVVPVGVRVHSIRSASRFIRHERTERPFPTPLPEPGAHGALRRIVAEFRPDVVHGHGWLAASLPGRMSAPLVMSAHDYGLICQRRTLLEHGVDVCSGPAPRKCVACGAATYGRPRSALMTVATTAGRALLRARRVLAVSTAVQQAIAPHLRMPVEVVSNFVVPVVPAEPLPPSVPDGSFVLYAGDPGRHKGVHDLLQAWAQVSADPGIHDPRLLLALTSPLRGPLPPGVTAAYLTPGQMVSAWQRASISVVPSRWPDPCPTVVLEAMRAGVPVIASRSGGIPDLLDDGVEGVLVPPGRPPALARAIAGLLADPDRAAVMGAAGRRRATQYTASKISAQILRVYGDVLREAPVGR